MRRVRTALFILAVAACGKGGGGSAPAASSGSAVATAALVPDPMKDALAAVAVTELAAGMHVDNLPQGPVVVITDKAIVVDGRAMVAIDNGVIDPVELEGGAAGIRISHLKAWADAWTKLPEAKDATVLIAAQSDVQAKLALSVLASFSAARQETFAFIVRTPDGPGAVPVQLPEAAPAAGIVPSANPEDQPIQMVLSVTPKQALLWSISGLEGTLSTPKLSLTPAAGGAWLSTVRDTLADVVNRRWGGGRARPDEQKTIIVMVDSSLATSDLVAAIAAVRHDAKGQPLYPDVLLSMGFELAPVADAKTPGEAGPPPKHDDEAVALEEEAARYAALLTAESSHDSLDGEMTRTRPGADLSAQIDEVARQSGRVEVGGGAGRGDRTPMVGTATGPRIDGVGGGSAGAADTTTPSGRVTIGGSTAMDDTSLTTDMILRKMMTAYMIGIKRCYKNGLKTDPSMRGKVVIGFTVNESGRSVNGEATGFDGAVDRCIESLVARWMFPRPKDADDEATEASFRITLTLTPD
jgi:hypothetical protein